MVDATNAQLAALTKHVELLVRTQTQRMNAFQEIIMYENCGANHSILDCMLLASPEHVNFVLYNPYSQTYNLSWKQHPNFRWSENQQSGNAYNAQQERRPSLGEMFQQFL
ncbi:DNA-directed DNA polymerase [Abeliophyllum distichum]|uniref:DNA-directed DNA polymerase n=1 Tax=Abeliophyllum distichum TaxID=126358 RepID=A0ABD1NSE5_9LAMI